WRVPSNPTWRCRRIAALRVAPKFPLRYRARPRHSRERENAAYERRHVGWKWRRLMANATHRCVALVGPYLSGKTSLVEALLATSGSIARRGSVRDGNAVGDHVAEARARQMSTELNVANATFLGDTWTILDCPGSSEL